MIHKPRSKQRARRARFRRFASLITALAIALAPCGCFTVEGNEKITDQYLTRTAASAIDGLQEHRRASALTTELDPGEQDAAGASTPAAAESETTAAAAAPAVESYALDLDASLEIAMTSSRRYLTAREEVDLSALSLRNAEHIFEPQLAGTLSALMNDSRGGSRSFAQGGELSVSQVLPFGGSASLVASGDSTQVNPEFGDTSQASVNRLSARIDQPLLRGAGLELTREPLTQAERNLVYSVRDFDLFRQDFAIEVISSYYGLVRQAAFVVNANKNLETLRILSKQSRTLRDIGRASELDLLRSEQEELSAENSLIDAEENLETALDRYKILLGLPVSCHLEIQGGEPAFIPVEIDPERAIEIARTNRLDYQTEIEVLEDSARHLRLAKNALLPDLNVTGAVDLITDPEEEDVLTTDFDERAWSLGVVMELPLDRVGARNAYRSARISHERRERAFELFNDNLENQVRSTLRQLRRTASTVDIQERFVEEEERRLRVANLRYEQGVVENRDVVDATKSLNQAKDRLVTNLVDYEIARIQLRRDLGILFLEASGKIVE